MTAPATTPTTFASLATLGDLEAHLGRPVDPVTGQSALDTASGWVRSYCGWSISLETAVTFTVNGSGTWLLDLPTLWLLDVHEVRLKGEILVNDADDFYGYDWTRAGQLIREAGWSRRARGVQADVTHGYDPVPQVIVGAVCAIAGLKIDNPGGVRMETVGTVIRQWHEPKAVASVVDMPALDMFRLPGQP